MLWRAKTYPLLRFWGLMVKSIILFLFLHSWTSNFIPAKCDMMWLWWHRRFWFLFLWSWVGLKCSSGLQSCKPTLTAHLPSMLRNLSMSATPCKQCLDPHLTKPEIRGYLRLGRVQWLWAHRNDMVVEPWALGYAHRTQAYWQGGSSCEGVNYDYDCDVDMTM